MMKRKIKMQLVNLLNDQFHYCRCRLTILVSICFLQAIFFNRAFSQTEVEPWGNIKGIRIDGQLIEFESSLQVVNKDWSRIMATALERQRPKYKRDGTKQIVDTRI